MELNQVYCMDALELCNTIADSGIQVDMILADLPYGITDCSWDSVIPLAPMWEAFRRVITAAGAIVLTASQPFTSELVTSGRDLFKYDWVWEKSHASNPFNAKNKPMKRHEDVLVFSYGATANGARTRMTYTPQGLVPANVAVKGGAGRKTGHAIGFGRPSHKDEYVQAFTNYPDSVLEFPNASQTVHPNQKPVALFEYLIRTYTQEGALVLDPCVGSGTTAIAARNCNRQFIVGDISPEFVALTERRLAEPYSLPMFD